MINTGMTPVSVADAMPTDQGTYLFIDSTGISPAMYVDPSDREFALAIGYDYWLRPKKLFDSLIPNKPSVKIYIGSEATHD